MSLTSKFQVLLKRVAQLHFLSTETITYEIASTASRHDNTHMPSTPCLLPKSCLTSALQVVLNFGIAAYIRRRPWFKATRSKSWHNENKTQFNPEHHDSLLVQSYRENHFHTPLDPRSLGQIPLLFAFFPHTRLDRSDQELCRTKELFETFDTCPEMFWLYSGRQLTIRPLLFEMHGMAISRRQKQGHKEEPIASLRAVLEVQVVLRHQMHPKATQGAQCLSGVRNLAWHFPRSSKNRCNAEHRRLQALRSRRTFIVLEQGIFVAPDTPCLIEDTSRACA